MAIRSPKWLVLTALVLAAPDTPGVYELWDDDEVVRLAATHGRTLREELIHELFETTGAHVTHFAWEISFHPEQRERELLEELQTARAARTAPPPRSP